MKTINIKSLNIKSAKEYLEDEINKLHPSEQPWYENDIYDGTASPIIKAIESAKLEGYYLALEDYENKFLEYIHPMSKKVDTVMLVRELKKGD